MTEYKPMTRKEVTSILERVGMEDVEMDYQDMIVNMCRLAETADYLFSAIDGVKSSLAITDELYRNPEEGRWG